jgi:lysophospholipase L1-like esterase
MNWDTQTWLLALQYGAFGATLVASIFLHRQRHGARLAGLMILVNLALMAAAVLGFPLWATYFPSNPSTLLFAVSTALALGCINLLVWVLPPTMFQGLLGILGRRQRVTQCGLAVLATIIPLGALESMSQVTTRVGIVPYFQPVETRNLGQRDDWRVAHIMDDNFREPDPLLLWRSVPRYPYSSQRFKGAEIAVPKPAGTFRIICYGDSNTDGPSFGKAYATQLGDLLDAEGHEGPRFEVVNAGVGGYSSYQGLLRFNEEVDRFTPDLILVSFGWNDIAGAIGHPDKEFAEAGLLPTRDPRVVFVRRLLLNYRFLLVAQHFISGPPPAPEAAVVTSSRVSLTDYEANLREFVAGARRRGIIPVLLTRPHRATPDELHADPSWRRHVPSYNETVLRVAHETQTLAIDVQRVFEGRPDMFFDECHLTNPGHRVMAKFLRDSLKAAGYIG